MHTLTPPSDFVVKQARWIRNLESEVTATKVHQFYQKNKLLLNPYHCCMLYMRGIKLLALHNAVNAQIQQLLKGYECGFCGYRSNSIHLKKLLLDIINWIFWVLYSLRIVLLNLPETSFRHASRSKKGNIPWYHNLTYSTQLPLVLWYEVLFCLNHKKL